VGGEYEEGDETIAYSVQKSVARTMISEKEEKEPAFAGEIPVIELRSDFRKQPSGNRISSPEAMAQSLSNLLCLIR